MYSNTKCITVCRKLVFNVSVIVHVSLDSRKKQAKEEVEKRLDVAFDKLFTIWDKIGIDEEQVCGRAATVSMHVCNLLDEMVSEEQQMCDNMATNIQRSIKQLSALSAELALPVVKVGFLPSP